MASVGDFSLNRVKVNTRRMDKDVQLKHFDQLVNTFQDFVIEFNKTRFTDGKRKLILFTVLRTEGVLF